MYQTKRWNEAIRMTDLKAQSPSLAITMRALFGRTTSRRLRFQARRTSRSVRIFRSDEAEILRRTVAATVIWRCRCSGRFPHLAKRAPVAATVRLGQLMLQTKRWNEAIRMADLKAQSPSLAITMRVLFGRTTSRRLGFQARRMSRSVRIFRSGEAEILRRCRTPLQRPRRSFLYRIALTMIA